VQQRQLDWKAPGHQPYPCNTPKISNPLPMCCTSHERNCLVSHLSQCPCLDSQVTTIQDQALLHMVHGSKTQEQAEYDSLQQSAIHDWGNNCSLQTSQQEPIQLLGSIELPETGGCLKQLMLQLQQMSQQARLLAQDKNGLCSSHNPVAVMPQSSTQPNSNS